MVQLSYDVSVSLDLSYGPAGARNLLDLYVPTSGAAPYPTVLCVHGGGFRGGNKDGWAARALKLAKHGYLCATINYRLTPDDPHPAAVDDAQLAVRWLRAHAAELGIDTDRIGGIGDSAGGHLVSMLGLVESKGGSGEHAEHSSKLQCVVDLFGPVDFVAMMDSASAEIIEAYIAKPFPQARDAYAQASPCEYVESGAPPFLIVHGTEDDGATRGSVPITVSRAFHRDLAQAGVSSKLVEIEGAGHGFGGEHLEQMWDAALPFFDEHLKKG